MGAECWFDVLACGVSWLWAFVKTTGRVSAWAGGHLWVELPGPEAICPWRSVRFFDSAWA